MDTSSVKISIIIPIYNEQYTISDLLEKIDNLKDLNKQLIIVNDGSTDNSLEIIKNYKLKSDKIILNHEYNKGKGSAIKTAKNYVTGDIILIQDADLEYDPNDYYELIKPILNKNTDVVYGSRVLNKKRYNTFGFTSVFRIFGNHFLTFISNKFNNQKLTDAHTCYKVFTKNVFDQIDLKENDFSFCPEITTKIANLRYSITEVPITYNGRSYAQGKKIQLIDGLLAIIAIIKYKFFLKNK